MTSLPAPATGSVAPMSRLRPCAPVPAPATGTVVTTGPTFCWPPAGGQLTPPPPGPPSWRSLPRRPSAAPARRTRPRPLGHCAGQRPASSWRPAHSPAVTPSSCAGSRTTARTACTCTWPPAPPGARPRPSGHWRPCVGTCPRGSLPARPQLGPWGREAAATWTCDAPRSVGGPRGPARTARTSCGTWPTGPVTPPPGTVSPGRSWACVRAPSRSWCRSPS